MLEVCNLVEVPEVSYFVGDIMAAADVEYLTVQDIAGILKISVDTVARKFENRKGVLDLGSPESRFTRRYRVLRIPRTVFEAYLLEIRVTA